MGQIKDKQRTRNGHFGHNYFVQPKPREVASISNTKPISLQNFNYIFFKNVRLSIQCIFHLKWFFCIFPLCVGFFGVGSYNLTCSLRKSDRWNDKYNCWGRNPNLRLFKQGWKRYISKKIFWAYKIIDEKDLNNQINYIHYNPVKHGYAKSVKDWKYSSFHKFVKNKFYDINWGSNTDIKEIIDLKFE